MVLKDLQVVAGIISTLMFVSSNLPMLWKAFTTKDLTPYSLGHISLSNIGNLIYWLYLFTLPVGPVWFLHGFNTVVAGLMVVGLMLIGFFGLRAIQSYLNIQQTGLGQGPSHP